jgi:nucleotide-binding universal stress UspA family protein
MSNDKKKILIAIDGSVQSMNAASYICGIFPPDLTRVVLYHVDAEIMDLFYDMEDSQSISDEKKASYQDWNALRKKHMVSRLEKIKDMFIQKGFHGNDVEVIIREISVGITRDIIEESKNGYDLLVVGKAGTRCMTGVATGTVTSKLISKMFHIPMVVVEGQPETEKFLVGYDGSQGSKNALRNLPSFVGAGKKVMICHVVRSMDLLAGNFDIFSSSIDTAGYPEFEVERMRNQKIAMDRSMQKQKEWLINTGLSEKNVQTCVMEDYISRSQALIEKAKKENYGSIVLGRRGHSAVLEFFIGRVGRKVIHLSDSMAVWIMN